MDFIIGFLLLTTIYKVFNFIFVIIYCYIKIAIYILVCKTIIAAILAILFMNRITYKFGIFKRIMIN